MNVDPMATVVYKMEMVNGEVVQNPRRTYACWNSESANLS
jgi:hypothetical protein